MEREKEQHMTQANDAIAAAKKDSVNNKKNRAQQSAYRQLAEKHPEDYNALMQAAYQKEQLPEYKPRQSKEERVKAAAIKSLREAGLTAEADALEKTGQT